MANIRVSPQRQRQMERAYEVRNLQGFEGDSYMRERVQQLIKDFNIDLVIEGGTFLGGTARAFSAMCKEVATIEINPDYYFRAQQILLPLKNVHMYLGSTVDILPDLFIVNKGKNILFWSDAHWLSHNPMLEELEIISTSGLKPVIGIHDFKVPNKPTLGYDTYGEITYEWDWIKESIEKIYGVDGYVKEYNDKATGAKRGVLYLYPKV